MKQRIKGKDLYNYMFYEIGLACIEEPHIVSESNEVVVVAIYVTSIYLFHHSVFCVMYTVISSFVIDTNVSVTLHCLCGTVLYTTTTSSR